MDEDDDGFDALPEAIQDRVLSNHFVYFRTKATHLLADGVDAHLRDAAGRLPPWASPQMRAKLMHGCKQLVAWRGLTPQTALTGLDIDGFYALAGLLRLELIKQNARSVGDRYMLDRMELVDHMSGFAPVLWNLVEMPVRKLKKSKKERRLAAGSTTTTPDDSTPAPVDLDALLASLPDEP
jgi:hypothetical protein